MITYNHAKFIRKALNSILEQNTAHEYEVVIGEDCSTDKTKQICQEYKDKYPDKIRLLNRKKNLGVFKNFLDTLEQCDGDFVAFCEGDDFWPDPMKLEMQVNFMINNSNAGGCYTDAMVVDEADNIISPNFFKEKPKSKLTLNEIVPFGSSPANTILFKREAISDLPDWFRRYPRHSGLNLLIAMIGTYNYINSISGAYRVHSGGVWSSKPASYRAHSDVLFLKALYSDKFFREKYGELIKISMKRNLLTILHDGIKVEKKVQTVCGYLVSFLFSSPFGFWPFRLLFVDVVLKRIILKIEK